MVARWPRRAVAVARNPHLWAILILFVLCSVYHYSDYFGLSFLQFPSSVLEPTRHAVDRVFYLLPIIYAGYVFGATAGLVVTSFALVLMLPRALFISPSPPDALLESAAVVVVGVLANLWLRARARETRLATERGHAVAAMVRAQEKLREQVRSRMKFEKDLTVLASLSELLVQSAEMGLLLRSAIDMVVDVIKVEVVLIFTLDEGAGELVLVAQEGLSNESARALDRMRIGEGFNGRVAATGEPLVVRDVTQDPRLTREAVRQEKLQAQLIVPMKSMGRVVGTICVATRGRREFAADEIELLATVGNGIGIAIENARLYEEQLSVVELLRQSEEHYRQLFEGAQDAIWVHDLDGNILSANKAAEVLTGFTIEELREMNVTEFLSSEDLAIAREVRRRMLDGQLGSQPYEQGLIRRDGTRATLKVTSSLVCADGEPRAFQNTARDITDEKRMQENLRFYVQQITRAQEDERLRIARELHDSTAQSLIALLHQVENLMREKARLPMDETRRLWAIHEQIKDTLQEVRYLSRDLRPSLLDDVGLLATLQWAVRQLKEDYGIDASLRVEGDGRRLPQEVELALFRIVQESLRNVGRHSGAKKVEVLIRFEDGKTVAMISDDGKGFSLPEKIEELSRAGKLGLVGMQERARLLDAQMEIWSEPGRGTSVIVELPP